MKMLPSRNLVLSKRTAFFGALVMLSVMAGVLLAEGIHNHRRIKFMNKEKKKAANMQRKLGDQRSEYVEVLDTFTERLDDWKLANDVKPVDATDASSRVAGFHMQADQLLKSMQNMEELLTEQEITLEEKEDILAFHELRFTEEDKVKESMMKYIVSLAKALQSRSEKLPPALLEKDYFQEAMSAPMDSSGTDSAPFRGAARRGLLRHS